MYSMKTITRAGLDHVTIATTLGRNDLVEQHTVLHNHVNLLVEDLRRSNHSNPLALAKLEQWAKGFEAAVVAADDAVAHMVTEIKGIVTELADRLANPRGPQGAAAGAF